MAKTIIKAINHNPESLKWSSWEVEYAEFSGRYFLSDADYKLQMKVQELIKGGRISEWDVDELLDLHNDVVNHDRCMEECD